MATATNKTFSRGKSRLFNSVWLSVVLTDALATTALSVRHNNLAFPPETQRFGFVCEAFPFSILFPILAPIKDAVNNVHPENIILNIVDKRSMKLPDDGIPHNVPTFVSLHAQLLGLVYSQFYEQQQPFIQQAHGSDTKAWPQLFQFAWMLRNGIVHHGGHVNFRNPSYPSVNWHTFSYSPTDNGTPIFSPRFSCGDLLMFLFDLSDELDAIGAPLPP